MNVIKAALAFSMILLCCSAPASQDIVEYIHTDALGSPVAVFNASGAVVERTLYEPYGSVIGVGSDDALGFTGYVSDSATGPSYMQQRYMDPELGMFLSVDPVTAYEQPVDQFDRYRYANSNPQKSRDPDGRFVQVLVGAVIGAGVEMLAQKLANPDAPINLESVAVSAGIGAISGGVASVVRKANQLDTQRQTDWTASPNELDTAARQIGRPHRTGQRRHNGHH